MLAWLSVRFVHPIHELSDGRLPAVALTMTDVRRTDPAARREAAVLVVLGAVVGPLLILGFGRYRTPLRDWLLAEPGEVGYRVKLAFFLAAALLSAPLIAFAGYLWSLGAKVVRTGEFPPLGYRVVRDTLVVAGPGCSVARAWPESSRPVSVAGVLGERTA